MLTVTRPPLFDFKEGSVIVGTAIWGAEGTLTVRAEPLQGALSIPFERYIYGDDAGSLQAGNGRGAIKLDFFVTKQLRRFASAYFEKDTFQDPNLRTTLASGPGYQFIARGDYDAPGSRI